MHPAPPTRSPPAPPRPLQHSPSSPPLSNSASTNTTSSTPSNPAATRRKTKGDFEEALRRPNDVIYLTTTPTEPSHEEDDLDDDEFDLDDDFEDGLDHGVGRHGALGLEGTHDPDLVDEDLQEHVIDDPEPETEEIIDDERDLSFSASSTGAGSGHSRSKSTSAGEHNARPSHARSNSDTAGGVAGRAAVIASSASGKRKSRRRSSSQTNHNNNNSSSSNDDDVNPALYQRSMSGGTANALSIERRESLASNDSGGGRSSDGGRSAQARMQQRKMMMAQQMSLGLDAEIKAQEAAAVPKRRSIFRTTGTASTPDLSTLIRSKKQAKQQQLQTSSKQMAVSKHQIGQGQSSANSSTTVVASHFSNALASSTSSLTGRRRESTRAAAGGADWDRQSGHSTYTTNHFNESQRQMATISETPHSEPLGRHTSVDESGKTKRSKMGVFGRMFGSSSSNNKDHGPLKSSSQLSLSARSQVDVASPQSANSPQLPSSPRFPGNAQYAFERTTSNGGTASEQRPPIPPRPVVPIMPKSVQASGSGEQPPMPTEAENYAAAASAEAAAAAAAARPVMVTRPSQSGGVVEPPRPAEEAMPNAPRPNISRSASGRSAASVSSSASMADQTMAQVLRAESAVYEPATVAPAAVASRPSSRRPTAEGGSPRPPGRQASSFSDDVTGLLDRIGHHEAAAAKALELEAERLQISPERHGSIGSASRYRAQHADKSPALSHAHLQRSPSATDETQLGEPLPVPMAGGAAPAGHDMSAGSSNHSASPVAQESNLPGIARDDVSEIDAPHVVPAGAALARVPSPRGDVPDIPPKQRMDWEKQQQHAASASNPRLDTDSLVIEAASSAGQSSTNLNDIGGEAADEEDKGRQLALEFYEGNPAHVSQEKVAMFLGGPRSLNNAALRHYMQYFDMRGLKLDQAFRDLCTKLHLKAESQEIDRIIEGFSARYYDCNPNTVYGTPGVVHTVTGAMLMLNTDLHIADIQKHMSRADFVRNSMRAIQESMPDRESLSELGNDSGSLRNIDAISASQSTTSVRLRNASGTPRNASGNLVSPASDLASTSTQDLRSRSSTTVNSNSFMYTKSWEAEAENVLKDIYSNVRNERILLPMGLMMTGENKSNPALLRGGRLKLPGSKNAPYNSMFSSHGDGRLSPTPSFANSIGDQQFQGFGPAIGFAGNLSHTVIREQDDEVHSVRSGLSGSTVEEMNDDELALLGAPWAKEGLLQRKIQVEAHGRKAQKKDWRQYFVVIQKGDLSMFVFGSSGSSSMGGGTVGGGNWMNSANRTGEYSLMHAMAMALPKPGYSASRPYCFTVTFPSGEISVYQAGTEELVAEWVMTCNYWAARKSRQPLVGGVSNIEYGWQRALGQIQDDPLPVDREQQLRQTTSSSSGSGGGARARLGAISRVRGAASGDRDGKVPMDKIHITEWKPPPHATMPSTLDEEAQLESLCAYVQSLKEELNQHKSVEEPMSRLYTPNSKNFVKARENWTAKSRYIHSEIFKYETYVEALRNAINLRVQRQGEKKLEKSLQRSAPPLQREGGGKPRKAGANGVGAEDGNGYATGRMSEDAGRRTPTK